jgi:dethiobiotin synthetase
VRPRRLLVVVGTGTDVGKTWVSARLLTTLREAGVTVAARKPVQSFDADHDPDALDSAVLGRASGEHSETVCLTSRWYEVAMAPPMAADVLGRARPTMAELTRELRWPTPPVDVGLVETAGGVRSPLADDGDAVTLVERLEPDVVLLVAGAELGTINEIRLSSDALPERIGVVVVLNRYDRHNDLHVRNRNWLRTQDGLAVVGLPGEERQLAALVRGA